MAMDAGVHKPPSISSPREEPTPTTVIQMSLCHTMSAGLVILECGLRSCTEPGSLPESRTGSILVSLEAGGGRSRAQWPRERHSTYCTIYCTIPDIGLTPWNPLQFPQIVERCGRRESPPYSVVFRAKSAGLRIEKPPPCCRRCFAQVLISRTLSICGEVAERLK